MRSWNPGRDGTLEVKSNAFGSCPMILQKHSLQAILPARGAHELRPRKAEETTHASKSRDGKRTKPARCSSRIHQRIPGMDQTTSVAKSYTYAHPRFNQLLCASGTRPISKTERLEVFLEVAKTTPPCSDMQSAKAVLDEILTAVEDAFSGVPANPGQWRNDGRMYPADEDYRRASPNPKISIYAHVGHVSYFGCNGAFRITTRSRGLFPPRTLIDRPGDDGRTIDDLQD